MVFDRNTVRRIIRQVLPPSFRKLLRTIQLNFMCFVLNMLPKEYALRQYNKMQKRVYAGATMSFQDAKDLCVACFDDHEKYPYEKHLLEKFDGKLKYALDFGCGMGRMMNRMLHHFEFVHGIDLMESNLKYASRYLLEHGWPEKNFCLFQSDGLGCKVQNGIEYDFIYSTICLQHIPVYEIRRKIISDIFSITKKGGQCCLQMVFGLDNGTYWFDNVYGAYSTNGGHDVSIPDETHLDLIRKDLIGIGFSSVEFTQRESPHEDFQVRWLFIHLRK